MWCRYKIWCSVYKVRYNGGHKYQGCYLVLLYSCLKLYCQGHCSFELLDPAAKHFSHLQGQINIRYLLNRGSQSMSLYMCSYFSTVTREILQPNREIQR